MWTDNGANQLLGACDVSHAGLNSDYPGESGANECSGGSPAYARKSVTLNSASGRQRTTAGTAVFDVPAGFVVRWITFWTALTVGNCRALSPNGADPKEFVVDLTNDRIYCEGHGYADGDKIVFYGGTPPAGLTAGTSYYAKTPVAGDPDYFQVAATAGGAAINITGQPAAGCVVSKIVEESFGAQGTFTLAAGAALGLNN